MKKFIVCLFLAWGGLLSFSMFNGCGNRGSNGTLLNAVNRPITSIVIHHTAGEASNDVSRITGEISGLHKRKFSKMKKSLGMYAAYHYLITPDGKMWKVRDPDDVGHHAGNWSINKQSVAIALVGNFSKYKPTKMQVQSLDALVKGLQKERRIKKIIPHSYCRATLCCGKYLKREIRRLSWGKYF